MSDDLYEGPSRTDKIIAQLKKHPLVPGGMIATCGALGMAFRRLHQRDSTGYQRWLRARVLAQGLTVVAIVFAGVQEFGTGAFMGSAKTGTQAVPSLPPMSPSEKVAFEKRMKEAEEAHDAETRILDQGKPSSSLRADFTPTEPPSKADRDVASPLTQPSPSSSSRFSWLRLWK
ncbi:hypothetical protein SCHPADRAFT_909119 [Schizopora paradoxa]|uniref:HIG1 domain-containing protein n=1 Tax=Schizopora paradoxa TaxID=27342 RepID=A0A0H2R7N0_9AGAM|nr:hypothetical protein SCHPADRAFT_909119 [Schizopora paradoxa]